MSIRALLAIPALALAFAAVARADDGLPPPAPAPAPAPTPAPAPAPTPATVERGFVGFTPLPVALIPEEAREEAKIAAKDGVIVIQILNHGPAAKAGLKLGDKLLQYAGQPIPETKDLDATDPQAAQEKFGAAFQKLALSVKVGAKVAIVVERDGKPVTLEAVAVDKAGIEKLAAEEEDDDGEEEESARAYVGFSLGAASRLTPKQRERWKITATAGVVALRVVPGSPAAKAGLKDGDVLVSLAGKPVPDAAKIDTTKPETIEAFQKSLQALTSDLKEGAKVAIIVQREGKPVTLEATAIGLGEMAKLMKAAGWDDDDEDGDDDEDEADEHEEGHKGEKPGAPRKSDPK